MDSWPPATTMRLSPLRIAWAPSATVRRPEPQTMLMPQAGVPMGRPAAMEAWRAGFWPWAAVSTWPRMTSLTSSRVDLGALQRGLDRDFAQLVRRHGRKGAAERADRGARRRNDDDVFHGEPPVVIGWLCIANCRECELVNCGNNITHLNTMAYVYAAQHFFAATAKKALDARVQE